MIACTCNSWNFSNNCTANAVRLTFFPICPQSSKPCGSSVPAPTKGQRRSIEWRWARFAHRQHTQRALILILLVSRDKLTQTRVSFRCMFSYTEAVNICHKTVIVSDWPVASMRRDDISLQTNNNDKMLSTLSVAYSCTICKNECFLHKKIILDNEIVLKEKVVVIVKM